MFNYEHIRQCCETIHKKKVFIQLNFRFEYKPISTLIQIDKKRIEW